MFASGPYQRGAIEFARSKGIALVRVFPSSQFKWVLHRDIPVDGVSSTEARDRVLHGLRTDNYRSQRSEFYCCAGDHFTFAIESLAEYLARESDLKPSVCEELRAGDVVREQVRFISVDEIEGAMKGLLKDIGYTTGAVDLDRISQNVGLKVNVVSRRSDDEKAQGVLGRIDFRTNEATIFPELNSGRRRFTLAHELGHFVLGHGKYLLTESVEESDFAAQADGDRDSGDIRRLEWQANCFAGRLLMPTEPLLQQVAKRAEQLDLQDRGHGLIFVDHQPVNLGTFLSVTGYLAHYFHVTTSAVSYRLQGLGLLKDVRS